MTDAVCTVAVASDPAVDGLASTGAAIALWAVLAAALMLAGIAVLVLRRRQRPLRGAAALAVLGLVLGGTVAGPGAAAPASAASGSCTLVRVTDVVRSDADDLLPGAAPVPVLEYSVTNATAFPIDISVATGVTDDAHGVAGLVTTLLLQPNGTTVTAPLGAVPTTEPLRLAPGRTARVAYAVALADTVGDEAQASAVSFDSTITARQA